MKGKELLSLLFGLFFGLLTWIAMLFVNRAEAVKYACFAGVLGYLLLYPVLYLQEKRMARRYAALEKTMPSVILCQADGLFLVENKMRSGRMYVLKDELHIVAPDKNPPMHVVLPSAEIQKIWIDDTSICILTDEALMYRMTSGHVPELFDMMRRLGWLDLQENA